MGLQWPPLWPPAHPLLVELQQLLGHLGSVERQPQAVDVELGDDVLQGILQGEAPPCPMLRGGGGGVLQDRAPQGDELFEEGKVRSGSSQDPGREQHPVLRAKCAMVRSLGPRASPGFGPGFELAASSV